MSLPVVKKTYNDFFFFIKVKKGGQILDFYYEDSDEFALFHENVFNSISSHRKGWNPDFLCAGLIWMDFDLKKVGGFTTNNFFLTKSAISSWKTFKNKENLIHDVISSGMVSYFEDKRTSKDPYFFNWKRHESSNFESIENFLEYELDDHFETVDYDGHFNTFPQDWDCSSLYVHNNGRYERNFSKAMESIPFSERKVIKDWLYSFSEFEVKGNLMKETHQMLFLLKELILKEDLKNNIKLSITHRTRF